MLHPVDLVVVLLWLLLTLAAGIWFSRRASRSTEDFFVSGRSLPWWVVGTSMVATTFAADTPLAVSGWVASHGIAENWVWWTFGLSGMVSVFLFSRYWRRSGILTDAELVELRYGPGAAWLRGAKGAWFGVFVNLLVIAWVMKAMTKIITVLLGLEDAVIWGVPAEVGVVGVLFVLTVVYTAASGLWGVVATDVVQFVVAMGSSVALAVMAWVAVGGRTGMVEGFARHGFDWDATTAIAPLTDWAADGAAPELLVLVCVIWWSQSNVDGGGYLAQRLFSAKDDRHALWAYLWFVIAHICLRPWPWIIVGLAGMALMGPVDDPETYYPRMMLQLLPPGLLGLMFASFLAAFMSTIDTQLNWGASMVVNDIYQRFVDREADQKRLMLASRAAVVGLAVLGGGVSFLIDDIGLAWKLAISVTAGLGSVYIARWLWWRVSAASEITAMAVAALCTLVFSILEGGDWAWLSALPEGWLRFPFSTAFTVALSIPTWLALTLLTRPVPTEHLLVFYERVRPGGPGWRAVAGHLDGFESHGPGRSTFLGILGGVVAVYSVLIGAWGAVVGQWWVVGVAAVLGVVGALVAGWAVSRETRRST